MLTNEVNIYLALVKKGEINIASFAFLNYNFWSILDE